MPDKVQFYRDLAEQTAQQLTWDIAAWTGFLKTASRLYKYPYHEQLLIYAQRPDATACAGYDLWNNTMRRYVKRGSHGIALLDTTRDRPQIKYVFDISDTGGGEHSRRLNLWEYRDEHYAPVSQMLSDRYGIEDGRGIEEQINSVVSQMVAQFWEDNLGDIFDIVDGSYLSDYNEDEIGVAFRSAAAVSTTYTILERCGLHPESRFNYYDFQSVFDFNTPNAISILGTAISQISERVLRQIEATIRNYEREKSAERSQSNEPDLSTERGLSNPEPGRTGDLPAHREVREDAEEVPAGEPAPAVEPADPVRSPIPAPAGDRADRERAAGADAPGDGGEGRRDGAPEGRRPDEVGGADEHHQSPGRGADSEGPDLRIEPAPVEFQQQSGEQISLFPSEEEQIHIIQEAESVTPTSFAFPIPQEVIDQFIRYGSNTEHSRMHLVTEVSKGKSVSALAEYLSWEFHGGYGIEASGVKYTAWYAEDGIHIAKGTAARYVSTAQVIPWDSAAARVQELYQQGQLSTNVELVEASRNERSEIAYALLILHRDLSEEAREVGYLSTMLPMQGGGFPEEQDRLIDALGEAEKLDVIAADYERFYKAYSYDRSLLRFHYHKLEVIRQSLRELSLNRELIPQPMDELPPHEPFITEDEVDANLVHHGSGFAGGKARLFQFFQQEHTPKEKTDFLKHEFGTGGCSHALSGAGGSMQDYDSKGIRYRKENCQGVSLSWSKVSKRIEDLIAKDRYLSQEERSLTGAEAHEEEEPPAFWAEYDDLKDAFPDSIVLVQVGDFYETYGEDARRAADYLEWNVTSRLIPAVGRIDLCGIPSHNLNDNVERLREHWDIVISKVDKDGNYETRTVPSIEHEAARTVDAHEAEFGADGTRAFPGEAAVAAVQKPTEQTEPQTPPPAPPIPPPPPTLEAVSTETSPRPMSQEEIDDALRAWNGKIESKHAVVRYMQEHGRERGTAAWLAQEFGLAPQTPLTLITVDGTGETKLPWSKVQRRIAQLIKAERFYTQEEYDNLDDVDPIAVRERLAESGIVNGEVVNPEALDNDPFIQQVMADADRVAQEEQPDAFTTPAGLTVHVGDAVAMTDEEGTTIHFQIVDIDADSISYVSLDFPGGNTISLERAYFEQYLDEYNGAVEPPASEQPQEPEVEPVLFEDRRFAEQNMIPDETTFTLYGRTYMIDRVNLETGNVNYQDITFSSDYTGDVFRVGRIDEVRALMEEAAKSEGIFYSPLGLSYRIGQTFEARFEDGSHLMDVQITKVDDQDVYYKLLEGSEQAETHIPRRRFDEFLEAGRITEKAQVEENPWPVDVGDTVYLEDGKAYIVEQLSVNHIQLRDPTLRYPIFRAESYESFQRLMELYPQPAAAAQETPTDTPPARETERPLTVETVAFYPAEENNLPFDVEIQTLRTTPPDPPIQTPPENFRITDLHLGEGGPKAKFRANMEAIHTLKQIESEGRAATPEEQETLSRYVGWGGLADAFDENKSDWSKEYQELKEALTPEEYTAARASTLNAHYTSPTVIQAIYEAVGRMGFQSGNILEPSMGIGNFFGMLPTEMSDSTLYGVELDSITGRIAKQLYPRANITVAGFETTDRKDFYDLAIGNVPFGNYQVSDRAYDKLGFSIHNYFFAKALDQVRPGGIVAFVTSRYTLDSKDSTARKYLAQRADFLGAIRLPNNAFRANAGTDVVSDIIILQKRDRPVDRDEPWVHLGQNEDGFAVNSYFVDHPEMILGRQTAESTQYGKQDFTVVPIEGLELGDQLHDAIKYIRGSYAAAELPNLGEGEEVRETIPADPSVKNYSYTIVNGEIYYRENSIMVKPELNATAKERVKGMVFLRHCMQELIDLQMDEFSSDAAIAAKQAELNDLYDNFTARYGLINDRANRLAFASDSSYYLLCSLEVLDENNELERKADFFTKRTIKQQRSVDHVDTAVETLAVSIGQKARVDLPFMAQLMGGEDRIPQIVEDLHGVIFKDPNTGPFDYAAGGEHWNQGWQTADEYLSGNVRRKLRTAERIAETDPFFRINAEALKRAQPKDLDASEIEVRVGSTWIDPQYYQEFMYETFKTPYYMRRRIKINYSPYTAEWQIEGKTATGYGDFVANNMFGTDRANAYRLLEDALNLRDIRIYDTIEDADGREKRVLNAKETTLAAQKQQAIREAFRDWIWKDPRRREALVKQYNEEMNSTRPREYDGSHLVFSGMNPEITLREHQLNAIAHVIYGGNTLLAHEVGAGKTFEMIAAAMESKRLGLCSKSLFVVPNHLTDQWASEFLRLYPSANILVTTKRDFEPHNRKKFCARIATGDYDAVIIGHSQFERIPISSERQIRLLQEQIEDITNGIEEMQDNDGPSYSIKQMEKTKRSLEARLKKLQGEGRKDDVVTFEQLGVDRLFVDESDNYKNLFLYTKMRNVAGLSTTDAQKSSDMFAKCRYMDELTGGRGVIFATGTPVSNSMTELYTIQRYLQYDRLQELGMGHFDCWASRFGETTTALELAPEGTGYRARTRFAKFFNLPELMNLFKEVADIKTADQLDLPTPEVEYHTYASKPTEIQQAMVKTLSERASKVHSGAVDPKEDNMLKITSDGRKLGLDQRIIDPMLPDDVGTKVNQCVANILQFWREGEDQKLTQLVFCDISTPSARSKAARVAAKSPSTILDNPEIRALEDAVPLEEVSDSRFTIYEDIRRKLIEGGMPPEQIAFIHDADTEVRKKELFGKVRSGQVRVLLGSTAKMGAGTNVQDRLIASHDLDCPWRPRDLIQRKGRIERQGNQNKTVHVCRYVTEGTFDAYLWQTVENKQKFISQIMTSKSPVRSCDDVDETALSFAEIKALCAGDPRIKERMDLEVEVSRLRIMKADHQSKQFKMEDMLLKFYPEKITQSKGFIQGLEADMKTLAAHPLPSESFVGMEIRGDYLTDKENAGAALIDACKEISTAETVQIGKYRGFDMTVHYDTWEKKYILTLKGQMTHRVEIGADPRGNLTRIENVLAKMPDRLKTVQAQLENYIQQQAEAQKEVGKPFEFEEELATKSARLVELDLQLNLDGRAHADPESAIAKGRPSILDRLKQPVEDAGSPKKNSHEMEVR